MSDMWDNKQANEEGWFVTKTGELYATPEFFGLAYDGKTWKPADKLALQFVQQKAREGSAYHIDALARIQLLCLPAPVREIQTLDVDAIHRQPDFLFHATLAHRTGVHVLVMWSLSAANDFPKSVGESRAGQTVYG